MTIKQHLSGAKQTLRDHHIPSANLDADLLLAHVLDLSREQLLLKQEESLDPAQIEAYQHLINRRAQHEPLSHLLGKREFWGREFQVTKDTLDPRPDSETLIEAVLSSYKDVPAPNKILDFGTGTGCLLLTLLAEFPNAEGVGIDRSEAALNVAKSNAEQLKLAKRVKFYINDWGKGVDDQFDVIVSNPPYIKTSDILTLQPDVRDYEPTLALDGGEDGLECYRALFPSIYQLLRKDGLSVVECGDGQARDISAIAQQYGLRTEKFFADLSGMERCVAFRKDKT